MIHHHEKKNRLKSVLSLYENSKHFSKWLDATTVHGIVHVFKGKSFIRRVIWSLIFIAAAVYCLYNIVDRARYFASNPSSTTFSVNSKDTAMFPAVTICNLNPINGTFAEEHKLVDLLQLYYQRRTFYYTRPDLFEYTTASICNYYVSEVANSSMTLRDLYTKGAISANDLIYQCTFDQPAKLCEEMFVPVMTNLGICYSINAKKETKLYSRSPGTQGGLNLLYDIHQLVNYIASYDSTAGVAVQIHPSDVLPDPEENGIAIPPGKSAYISLTTQKIDDQTGNGCAQPGKPLKYFPNYDYSVSSCRANIYAQAIAENCSCLSPVSTLNNSGVRDCTVADLCCIMETVEMTDVNSCISTCQRTVYSTSVSYAEFPDDVVASQFQQLYNLMSAQTRSEFLTMNVYFQSLAVTNIVTSYSYSFTAFLSDLGGQLGLFVGASVISMLEIGLLLFDLLKAAITRFCCKKAKSPDIEMGNTDVK